MSLSEVSRRTGISMPTLLRYKKQFADRIPSSGSGRKQRYPEAALAVITQLKQENMAKRGRRRRAAGRGAAKNARRRAGVAAGLLSLSEVGRRTGISYPTLLRYVALHLDRLPHVGSGRTRRFRPAAVEVFAALRRDSRRGRRPAAGRPAAAPSPAVTTGGGSPGALTRRLEGLERGQAALLRELRRLSRSLDRPLRVSVRR